MASKFQRRLDEQKKSASAPASMPEVATVVARREAPAPAGNEEAFRLRNELARPSMEPSGQIVRVKAEEIYEVGQVRPEEDFDEEVLAGMVDSLSELGNLTPPRCFPKDRQGYRVWFGATRVRSMKRRGDEYIDIYVGTPPRDDRQRIMGQLIENLQQSGLKPLATALAFEKLKNEHGMSGEDIARALGKPTAFVSKHMRIGSAPEKIRFLVRSKKLSDVELIYNLIQLNEASTQSADDIISKIQNGKTVTRAQVKKELSLLKGTGKNKGSLTESLQEKISHAKSHGSESAASGSDLSNRESFVSQPDGLKGVLTAVISYRGQDGILLLDIMPDKYGMVWIESSEGKKCVPASEITLLGLR